jgi:hypothetical protein
VSCPPSDPLDQAHLQLEAKPLLLCLMTKSVNALKYATTTTPPPADDDDTPPPTEDDDTGKGGKKGVPSTDNKAPTDDDTGKGKGKGGKGGVPTDKSDYW